MSSFSDVLTEAEASIVRLALSEYAAQCRINARCWEGSGDSSVITARERELDEAAHADRIWGRIVDDMREARIANLLTVHSGGS